MQQKTKIISVIVIILLITIGVGVYFFRSVIFSPKVVNQKSQQPKLATQSVEKEEPKTEEKSKESRLTVEGKVRSINATQVFIELADGSGAAINISANTPVKTEGEDRTGNLSTLKIGAMVSIDADQDNNALEILIKE
jgi:ribosomal protein S1